MNKLYSIAVLSLLAAPVLAEEDKKFQAKLNVGINQTSGNTSTQSITGKLDIKQDFTNWRNHYVFDSLFKRNEVFNETRQEFEDDTAAERYFLSAQADYKISKKHAAFFVYGEYDRNRFSGFDFQYTLALGYADRLFTTDNSYFSYEVGPGVTVNKEEDPDPVPANEPLPERETNFIVRVSAKYLYKFSDNAEFTQTLSSNVSPDSDENTKTRAVSSITTKINSSFSLNLAYTVDYNSEVAEGRKNADTETSVTIGYTF